MLKRSVSSIALILVSGSSYAFEFDFKGMLKAEAVGSNSGIASYGSAYSQVAPTNALRTDIYAGAPATAQETEYLDSNASSLQIAQSRFSFNMKHKKVRTIFEFDFIDGEDGFTNQTAIQSQEVRVRLATVYYDWNEKLTLFGGQKWSTAAGIKSSGSYNWIGNAYRAGNSGFLAMEAGATYKNAGWEVTGALTGRGRNNSNSGINANELGSTPGIAVDVNYNFSGHKVGFAGHTAQVNFEKEPGFVSGKDQTSNLYKIYGQFKFGDVQLAGEYYTGDALNNQNALGVAPSTGLDGSGVVRESFGESGFFTYLSWNVQPGHTVKVGYASAEVDSGDQNRLSLTELSKNTTAYINYGAAVDEGFTVFTELTHFDTEYGGDFKNFTAVVARAGVIFKF